MTTFETVAASAARSKIVACEGQFEAWQIDHEKAMVVFSCETLLANLVETYGSLTALNADYARYVFANPNSYNYDFDQGIKKMFLDWLVLSSKVERDLVRWCTSQGYSVNNADLLTSRIADARIAASKDFDEDATELIYRSMPHLDDVESVARATCDWPE